MGTRPAMYDRRNLQSGPSNNKRRFCTEYKCYLQRHQEIKKMKGSSLRMPITLVCIKYLEQGVPWNQAEKQKQ